MKIKILASVAHNGHILQKDSVHDVPAPAAKLLIEGDHAKEYREPKPEAPGDKK